MARRPAREIETRGYNREVSGYVGFWTVRPIDASLLLMGCLDMPIRRTRECEGTFASVTSGSRGTGC